MDLLDVYTVPAFSLVYISDQILRDLRILRIPENEREPVEKQL